VVLQNALTPILADYDFAVLDCPPSLGLLTVNALTVADFFFIVPLTLFMELRNPFSILFIRAKASINSPLPCP
jgi:hypothetical protein